MPFTLSPSWRIRLQNFVMRLILAVPLGALLFKGQMRAFRVFRELAYRPDATAQQRLDVYVPAGNGLRPVVLYIHGGGFVLGSKSTHRLPAARHALAGQVVFNINYRTAPAQPYPAALEDCAAAYRWVVDNAHRFGGDPARITIAGESAGGNLAANLLIADCYKRSETWAQRVWSAPHRPAAVQLICGYFQVTAPERLQARPGVAALDARFGPRAVRSFASAYLGRGRTRPSEINLFADPVRFLERGLLPDRRPPPVFLPVGTGDLLCDETRRMERALNNLQFPLTVRYYPDEAHAFHLLFWRPVAAQSYWRDCAEFLRSVDDQALPLAGALPQQAA